MTKRILIIDDQSTVREAVIRFFIPPVSAEDQMAVLMGAHMVAPEPEFSFTEAASGEDGVEILRQSTDVTQSFAAAIVDMRMPGINGIETIRRIRAFNKNLPLIVYSGWVDFTMPELQQANGGGEVAVVAKPQVRDLRDAVRNATRSLSVTGNLRQEK